MSDAKFRIIVCGCVGLGLAAFWGCAKAGEPLFGIAVGIGVFCIAAMAYTHFFQSAGGKP